MNTPAYADILHRLASSPRQLDDADLAELRRICREYPADALAPALLLRFGGTELSAEEVDFARARVSLYCGQPGTLIKAIDPSGKGFDSFYPPLPTDNRPSTVSAIDLFLETYGHQSAQEDALLERMIFNPVPDYAEQLARQAPAHEQSEEAPAGSQDALIDAFLKKNPVTAPDEKEPPAPEPTANRGKTTPQPDSRRPENRLDHQPASHKNELRTAPTASLLSESLAKIFIKQGRYERAFEIISNLNLNYPEKSVYFADQLRFLEKLIINQRYSNRES